ncbi:hypothetical protein [Labrys sp. ZIDIC5]|uniref:hypothetical protein n=1 Tax=Labrys sedimenti TaxID=3106036 RepID=UPI002ACA7A59|nr:hypothetical protein [Labrys sp. ZIDIC5]MDZ5449362.1 hypothetical protein [Labrys sp. ZIDIC5]
MEFSLLLVANRQGLAGNAFAWRDIPGAERDGNIEHHPQSGGRFSEKRCDDQTDGIEPDFEIGSDAVVNHLVDN